MPDVSVFYFIVVPSWSCSKAVYKLVWHIPLLSVQWINSWWWIEELSETCRVSCQNKFVKLVHLVGFIIKKFVTMHGHTNVKNVFKVSFKQKANKMCFMLYWQSVGTTKLILSPCWIWGCHRSSDGSNISRDKWVLFPWHRPSLGCWWRNGLQIWKVAANVLNK